MTHGSKRKRVNSRACPESSPDPLTRDPEPLSYEVNGPVDQHQIDAIQERVGLPVELEYDDEDEIDELEHQSLCQRAIWEEYYNKWKKVTEKTHCSIPKIREVVPYSSLVNEQSRASKHRAYQQEKKAQELLRRLKSPPLITKNTRQVILSSMFRKAQNPHYEQSPLPILAAPVPEPLANIAQIALFSHQEEYMDELLNQTTEMEEELELMTTQEVNLHVTNALSRPGLQYATHNDLTMLKQYTANLLKEHGMSLNKINSSLLVARAWHPDTLGVALARRIRSLFTYYRAWKMLPVDGRGGSRKGRSILDDERVFEVCRVWLLDQKEFSITTITFRNALNKEILPRLPFDIPTWTSIPEITAYRWLIRLGFSQMQEKKGVYFDGHERPDVTEYRDTIFLPQIAYYDRLTRIYTEIEGKLVETCPSLEKGEVEHVMFFHDESCFHAYDFKKRFWCETTQQKIPRKGGKGKLIHVSDFIGPQGRIVHRVNGVVVDDARKVIYPGGANGDPWWNTEQLLVQIKHAINLFEKEWPAMKAVFIFDQSSAHNSYGEGALNAFSMNLTNGGEQPFQKDTYFPPETRGHPVTGIRLGLPPVGDVQNMWFYDEEKKERVQKGIRQVLDERWCLPKNYGKKSAYKGASQTGKKAKKAAKHGSQGASQGSSQGSSQQFQAKTSQSQTKKKASKTAKEAFPEEIALKCIPRCPDPSTYPIPEKEKRECCLARILQNHQDFAEQKSVIAQTIEDRGHICLFLPKFHCELNAIEMYWGYSKTRFRQVIKENMADAKKRVIECLDACSIETMRKFCNKSFRFMDAYRKGLTIKQAAWCARKQKGHRSISKGIMEECLVLLPTS